MAATASLINMEAIECTHEQLQHGMQVMFQQLCVSQLVKFKKDGMGADKNNCNEIPLGNVEFKDTCYQCNKQGHKASESPNKKNGQSNNQQAGGSNQYGACPFKGMCNKWGEKGHKGTNCPKKNNSNNHTSRANKSSTSASGNNNSANKEVPNANVEFV